MAQDQPKPLFVRLLLFVVGGFCAVAIVTMAVVIPLAMVANWGGGVGGPGQALGGFELLVGLSILAAGFGLPHVIFARDTLGWKWLAGILGVMAVGLIWAIADQDGYLLSFLIMVAIAAIFGTGFFFSFRALSGRTPPSEWKDMP
ncbi:hypothetical protein [Gymnodinialimonas hymeniacidonis]|uniref:hypothetical protein n=1 Tax=Gymnodinialimonas hymeniacidonis TaxID=3126508 RepID=UPI0034C6A51D